MSRSPLGDLLVPNESHAITILQLDTYNMISGIELMPSQKGRHRCGLSESQKGLVCTRVKKVNSDLVYTRVKKVHIGLVFMRFKIVDRGLVYTRVKDVGIGLVFTSQKSRHRYSKQIAPFFGTWIITLHVSVVGVFLAAIGMAMETFCVLKI